MKRRRYAAARDGSRFGRRRGPKGARLALLCVSSLLVAASADGAAAEPPLAFRLQDNLIHVSGLVDGKPVSAVLDSGTGGAILDHSAAQRLGIAQGTSTASGLGAGSGAQPLFPIHIDSMTVGSLRLVQVSGFAMDLTGLSTSAGFPIEAIIGAPAFVGGEVDIDYPARQLAFRSKDDPSTCRAPIPIRIANGVPVAEVTVRPRPGDPETTLHLIVDLGTRHFAAMIGGPFLRTDAGRALLAGGVHQQVGTGTGGTVDGAVVNLGELRLGDHHYPDLRVALTANNRAFEKGLADGTLGVPLWAQGRISLDYPRQRLCLSGG